MTFLEKLDFLMKKNGLKNIKQLSDACGIPYTTIRNWSTRGYDKISLSCVRTICDYFHVTIDSMTRDEVDDVEYYDPDREKFYASECEKKLVLAFRHADPRDQELALRSLRIDQPEREREESAS